MRKGEQSETERNGTERLWFTACCAIWDLLSQGHNAKCFRHRLERAQAVLPAKLGYSTNISFLAAFQVGKLVIGAIRTSCGCSREDNQQVDRFSLPSYQTLCAPFYFPSSCGARGGETKVQSITVHTPHCPFTPSNLGSRSSW